MNTIKAERKETIKIFDECCQQLRESNKIVTRRTLEYFYYHTYLKTNAVKKSRNFYKNQ